MRPRRLEVSGFTAFRDPAVVDFADAELFALTGPTGAGKSSLIDAIVFALYGSVPRYADRRAVAPLVTLGKLEARVRFDFTLEEEDWTAVRVVRRTASGGASTDEARLERGDEVVAGTADGVSEAVTDLFGLGFEHFTKSVVLPQGEFARFLHDRPAERQSLLRSLLDLEVYGTVREGARQLEVAASERVRTLESRRSALEFATPAARAEAADLVLVLERLHDSVATAEPELEREVLAGEVARANSDAAAANAGLLEGLEVPEKVPALGERQREARELLRLAETTAAEAATQLTEAERLRGEMGDRAELTQLLRSVEELNQKRIRRETLRNESAALTTEAIEEELRDAAEALKSARERLDEARSSHAAHRLASELREGETCPVCGQAVHTRPEGEAPPDLEAAVLALAKAEAAAERMGRQKSKVEEERARLEGRLQDADEALGILEAALSGGPALEELADQLDRIEKAETHLAEARQRDIGARRAVSDRRQQSEELDEEAGRFRKEFDLTRDRVAKLEPPQPTRENVALDWAELAGWADARRREFVEEASENLQKAAGHHSAAEQLAARLDRMLSDEGLVLLEDTSREKASFEALTAARHQLDRVSEAVTELEQLEAEIRKTKERGAVAETLALHLRSDRFEAWLLDEALRALVAGANELLAELSSAAYSLRLAGRRFEVVDHRNADEARSVRTLSGGETFLVSLSLALSLAEQLSSMSARGGPRIETIFLDEGFGTLDRETLETVGAVIHELGARGRTVGLVTHVTELAEQVPVRFEVTKGPSSATVIRVET